MSRPSPQQVEDAQTFGYAILKANGDDYVKTEDQIRKMSITNIRREGTDLVIETARPGVVIGYNGKTFDVLKQAFNNRSIRIVESFSWSDLITPIDPNEWDIDTSEDGGRLTNR